MCLNKPCLDQTFYITSDATHQPKINPNTIASNRAKDPGASDTDRVRRSNTLPTHVIICSGNTTPLLLNNQLVIQPSRLYGHHHRGRKLSRHTQQQYVIHIYKYPQRKKGPPTSQRGQTNVDNTGQHLLGNGRERMPTKR